MSMRCIQCGHEPDQITDQSCVCCYSTPHCLHCCQPTTSCWCCECHEEYPCPENGPNFEAGSSSSQTPWEKRGVELAPNKKYLDWKSAWQILALAHKDLDVCQAAADFYIFDAIRGRVLNREHDCAGRCHHMDDWHQRLRDISDYADRWFAAHVAVLDSVFQEYVEMACGGELRHHAACGGKSLSTHRRTAWADWKWIHEQLGHQALLDGAELFDEFPSGSFGGARWAFALRLLHQRVTDQITPMVWVDQVFTLVHNGGVFLNKLEWGVHNKAGYQLIHLQGTVLPAQQRDSWRVLLGCASPDAVRMWDHYWREANRYRLSMAMHPALNPRLHVRSRRMCVTCQSNPAVGHTLSCGQFLNEKLDELQCLSVAEEDWGQYNWSSWEQTVLPVSPQGQVRILPTEAYTVLLEIHTSYACRVKSVRMAGLDLMNQTITFGKSIPTIPGWDEDENTEYWFRILLCNSNGAYAFAGFESRRLTNRGVFAKKYLTFGHILPLVMPELDWSYVKKETV